MAPTAYLTNRPPVIEVVDPVMAEVLRKKTEAERLAISWSLWDFARRLIGATLRSEHADWTEAQVQRETTRRMAHESR